VAWVATSSNDTVTSVTEAGVTRAYGVVSGTFNGNGGISVAADGSLWLAETNLFRVGRLQFVPDPALAGITTGADSRPLGLAYGPDGAIWIALNSRAPSVV